MAQDKKGGDPSQGKSASTGTRGNPEAIAIGKGRRRSSKAFQAALQDGGLTPSTYLLGVLRGSHQFDEALFKVASQLLPHELPKLQSVEAEVVDSRSHEDALDELDREDAETDA